jgi:hypothetical protein
MPRHSTCTHKIKLAPICVKKVLVVYLDARSASVGKAMYRRGRVRRKNDYIETWWQCAPCRYLMQRRQEAFRYMGCAAREPLGTDCFPP